MLENVLNLVNFNSSILVFRGSKDASILAKKPNKIYTANKAK